MSQTKSDDLRPGTILRHASGGTVVLSHRKDDESGWWNTDGSGLSDSVFDAERVQWEVIGYQPTATNVALIEQPRFDVTCDQCGRIGVLLEKVDAERVRLTHGRARYED